jgi:hypothetical protein
VQRLLPPVSGSDSHEAELLLVFGLRRCGATERYADWPSATTEHGPQN